MFPGFRNREERYAYEAKMRLSGKFRAVCRDNNDPELLGRIRVEAPHPLGTGRGAWSVWAWPCFTPGSFYVPEEGDLVWIEFVNGNPNDVIWTGIFYSKATGSSDAPYQAVHAPLTDSDGNVVDRDVLDHFNSEVDTAEHKVTHDHGANEAYTPHREGHRSQTGHELEFNDHPGTEGFVALRDRAGRVLRMAVDGVVRVAAKLALGSTSEWQNPDGADADGQHYLEMVDNEDPGTERRIRLSDMSGATLTMRSTPGEEEIEIKDFWGQYVRIRSQKNAEYIELVDKAGSTIRLDATTGKVQVTAIDDVEVVVPSENNVHIGGLSGQELATKTFVQTYYNSHIHATPAGPSGPPQVPSPLTPGSDITKKQLSE